jgi:HlyD family secretion protein
MRRFLIGVVVLVLAGAGGYYAWGRFGSDGGKRLDVQTTSLQRADIRRVINTSGTVKARVTVDVSVQVSGQISERPVDYNSVVKKGDLLARIDPLPFETKIRQLEASIAIAEASVAVAKSGVEKAQINAAKAATDYERHRSLVASGAVTRAALETAENADKLAKADVTSANAQLQNANAGLKQRRAEMETAQIDLDHTYIRAPIDGIVVDRLVEVGQTVNAGSTAPKLFTLAQDLGNIDISAVADEADVAQIAVGNPVTFRVDAFPDVTFSGQVWQVRLAPTTQQNVVTYTVIIRAQNPGNRLLPGMTANLQIVTGERRGVMVVSNEALRFQPRGSAATLVKGATSGPSGAAAPARAAPLPAGGPGDAVATLQRDLDLDDATMNQIRVALRDVANVRAAAGGATPARPGAGAGGAGGAAALRGGGGPGGPVLIRPGGGPGGGPGPGPGGGLPGGDLAATVAAAAGGTGSGDDAAPAPARVAPNDVRDQIRARTDEVLRGILTPEQFAKYQALQLSRDGATRIGSVWVHEADGSLSQHQVTLGLASLNTTEVVNSNLPADAQIVLRVREVAR